jgi:hypoxanthine phosphoribosyltransferase
MKIIVDPLEIKKEVERVGQEITQYYRDHMTADEKLVLVGVLKGCSVFLADLIRCIDVPFTVSFYNYPDQYSITQKHHVLLVDGICDTGLTLLNVAHCYTDAASIRTCVLYDKKACRTVPVVVHWAGFSVNDKACIVGYGMDEDQCWRGLPYIGVIK